MNHVRTLFVVLLMTAACGAPPEEPLASEGPVELGQAAQLLRSERAIPDQYIVVLRDEAEAAHPLDVATVARELAARHGGTVLFTYHSVLQGFAVRMPRARLEALLEDPRVAYAEEDSYAEAAGVQASPPWGLDRVDERALPMDSYFRYTHKGSGVRAYIIDTGIRLDHVEFGGRALTGYDAITSGGTANDCHGHGTHVAGIVGGTTYGAAKASWLYAVRVLNCSGSGSLSGVISAVDWVRVNHVKPAVAVMSLTTSPSSTLDSAVNSAINSGILFVVAAGNNNASACNYSPAKVPAAFTVGATTKTDARLSSSNFGSCLDLFAPGHYIPSAWASSPTATYTYSGTSMAAAHTGGAAAIYLEANPTASPSTVTSALITNATTGVVTDAGVGSANRLLYIPPPVISIVSPMGGTVSGTVSINTITSESVAVTQVNFYMGSTFLGSDTSAPFSLSWNTVPYAGGTRTLTARAYNGSTLVAISDSVSVNVADITPPTTSLTSPTAGSTVSGTVSLAASASDNVGVTRVDFYLGTTLLGSDTSAPYGLSWNTTSLPNGSYSLSTRAYDAAGNAGVSAAVSVTVACNSTAQLLDNPGFESGLTTWVALPTSIINNFNLLQPPHSGSYKASMGGSNSTATLFQDVFIPSSLCGAELSFWMRIDTIDGLPDDSLSVTLHDTSGVLLQTLATYSNLESGFSGYAEVKLPLDLSAYRGTSIRIQFASTEDSADETTFLIDDTALNITQ